jgi:signal transduction histidine kinase
MGGTLLLLATGLSTRNQAGVRVGVVPPVVAAATLVAVLVGAAAVAWSRREGRPRVASGCLLASAGGLLPIWATAPPVPSAVGALVLAAPALTVTGAATAGTGWSPDGPRLRVVQVLAGAALLVHALAYDPFRDPSCRVLCDPVAVPFAGLVPTQQLTAVIAVLVTVAAATGGVAVWRARLATPGAVVAASLLALLVVGLVATVQAFPPASPVSLERALVPGLVAGCLPSLGVLVALWLTQRTRRAVRQVVQRLGSVQGGLEALPDPVVAVQVATPEGGWFDAKGADVVTPPPEGSAVQLGPDVRLVVRAGGADATEVVGRLGAADLVAVSNARLAALTRAHQRAVRASQRRIVTLSDQERLRIERDLHDGAQQRLVVAKLYLSLAASAGPPEAAQHLRAVEQQVQGAIERLRALAHGAFPVVLESEGLVGALEELAAGSPITLHLELDPLQPADSTMSRAARVALYSAAAVSVRAVAESGDSQGLAVRGRARPGWVGLDVVARGPAPVPSPGSLQQAADRLGACEGRLTLREASEGWTVTAEVPCESS